MTTLSTTQHMSALHFPWHAKRGQWKKMSRTDTPCSSSQCSRITSPVDKESIRRQIVGLALKGDTTGKKSSDRNSSAATKKSTKSVSVNDNSVSIPFLNNPLRVSKLECIKKENSPRQPSSKSVHVINDIDFIKKENSPRQYFTKHDSSLLIDINSANKENSPRSLSTKHGTHLAPIEPNDMSRVEIHNSAQTTGITRSKTPTVQFDRQTKPKIVRFRMDDCSGGRQRSPVITINDNASDYKQNKNGYEVRGSAITVRKEGLKGLLAYKDICEENEKRQNSLQASLKIFRRRIKLNQEKFIQPNESPTDDYVINRRTPFCDVNNAVTQPQEDGPTSRPMSSDDHVRILRSALQNKHNGGNTVVKQTDSHDTGETYKNIKCSYRLPENPNWGKEVSFKDIKDDSIPNVKTYVLAQETHPHAKFKKNHIQSSVTLNTHNLSVHNSITHVNGHKMKVGEDEVAFDPRFVDWLEDSLSNVKLFKSSTFMSDDGLDCSTPGIKRRIAAKT